MQNIKNKKIIVYVHHGGIISGGYDDKMFSFILSGNPKEAINIKFPFGHDSVGSIRTIIFKEGEKSYFESQIKFHRPEMISYLKDFFYGLFYGMKYGKGADLFVAMDSLLVLVGLLLRKLGYVKKVAYSMIDYTPQRYENIILDKLYYFIDKIACYHSDVVWPLHKRMIEGRAEDGKINKGKINFLEVPTGNESDQYADEDYANFNRKKVVYFGGVLKSKGADLFIPIVKSLIDKGLSDVIFECIGGGDIDYLKEQARQYGVEKNCIIHGRVNDPKEVDQMLLRCGVAIAPFYPEDKNNFSYYADPGKVKIYVGCGLPVIITDVPPVAKDLEACHAGLIAKYDADDFADKILEVISDEKRYRNFRNNALQFGRQFAWPKVFEKALNNIL